MNNNSLSRVYRTMNKMEENFAKTALLRRFSFKLRFEINNKLRFAGCP